jgi:hypothetical protein
MRKMNSRSTIARPGRTLPCTFAVHPAEGQVGLAAGSSRNTSATRQGVSAEAIVQIRSDVLPSSGLVGIPCGSPTDWPGRRSGFSWQ